ncbi:hypothetical protein C8Q73DRAFT_708643 [Cubamyces lactineus]|nr:hypothetical protein C8Q73DRAFT_708643 [Cubamyces lactineus]
MSPKKLRSKLEQVRHFLPLMSPRARAAISPNEKMLQPIDNNADIPPPPPPKDCNIHDWDDVRYAIEAAPLTPDTIPIGSPLSDTANSHVIFLARQMKRPPSYSQLPPLPNEMGVLSPPSPKVPPKPSHTRTTSSRIPIAAGRLTAAQRRAATVSTPEEAALRRREAQRRKEQEEAEALREEAQRQARLKREKEELLRQYAQEEEARKAALEAELRHAAEERKRREAIEREAAALESMLVEERKRQDRERRRLETEKLQQWRKQLEERNRVQQEERMRWRERTDRERRARAAGLAGLAYRTDDGTVVLLKGWLTVQSEDFLSWKRRHFELREDALMLFKDAEDDSQLVEAFTLSRIQRIREWQEGFEELEPIPNSFALELKGERDARSMFTDSADDKENLLALLTSRLSTR